MIIKLLGSKKDKDKGFYTLMINGGMFSDELNVFQGIDKKQQNFVPDIETFMKIGSAGFPRISNDDGEIFFTSSFIVGFFS